MERITLTASSRHGSSERANAAVSGFTTEIHTCTGGEESRDGEQDTVPTPLALGTFSKHK